jgi:hypothetical protein
MVPPVEQYFRVAEPGSRPDTVILRNVPADWFGITMQSSKAQYSSKDAPLRKAMVKFGPVRWAGDAGKGRACAVVFEGACALGGVIASRCCQG